METIHKKNGRLHIYVRQDKYKGELKSHNWVGRTYINGKQKIVSSGTTNLEEAIPILEKWYDDLQVSSEEKDQPLTESKPPQGEEVVSKMVDPPPKIVEEKISSQPTKPEKAEIAPTENPQQSFETTKSSSSIFEKLKNIKISKPSFGKKNPASEGSKIKKTSKFAQNLQGFFKSKVSKMSVAGEEIVGVDITNQAVRVAQVSKDKNENWILDKISYRLLDQEKIGENLLEYKEYLSEEISLALANAKITTKNVALSIPVTSAIIRVVTSPLITEVELKKAIETDSLWENLVQLGENLSDYSIFHQVINRNSKTNTMDILFVASKLSDVNAFSSIIKKAGLNPVIMDVRCFTLKNAFDNLVYPGTTRAHSAIMEIGIEENYLMIIHNNIPIITDVFLRPQEKQNLFEITENQESYEGESVIRRYAMQIKQ